MAYVPDDSAQSSTVDRLAWDPATRTFFMLDGVALTGPGGQRPSFAALGTDGNLYVASLRATTIQRIVNPETATSTVQVVGNIDRLAGLAAGVDAAGTLALYAAEPTGVTRLYPNAAAPASSQPTNMALGLANPATPFEPGALTFDVASGALYVGTASAAHAGPVDKVMRFTVAGRVPLGETLDTGYDTVAGLALGTGQVAVFDGPAGDTAARMSVLVAPGATPFVGPLPAPPAAGGAVTGAKPVVAGTRARSAVARISRLRMGHRLRIRRLRRVGLRITLTAARGTTAVEVRVRRRGGRVATRLRGDLPRRPEALRPRHGHRAGERAAARRPRAVHRGCDPGRGRRGRDHAARGAARHIAPVASERRGAGRTGRPPAGPAPPCRAPPRAGSA
jgi:hypothetical protein